VPQQSHRRGEVVRNPTRAAGRVFEARADRVFCV
jgi:hypothetical protein